MTGIICMWHGLIVDIPNGWALCDGTNGTPDLRSRFVAGCPDGIDPGGQGGHQEHRHWISTYTASADIAHAHDVLGDTLSCSLGSFDYTPIGGVKAAYHLHYHSMNFASQIGNRVHNHRLQVWSAMEDHIPPFYAILFIMKV